MINDTEDHLSGYIRVEGRPELLFGHTIKNSIIENTCKFPKEIIGLCSVEGRFVSKIKQARGAILPLGFQVM